MKFKFMIVMLVALVVTGCSKVGDIQATVSDGIGTGDVTLVMLRDGTKCAVLIGYSKGAISCDWRSVGEFHDTN